MSTQLNFHVHLDRDAVGFSGQASRAGELPDGTPALTTIISFGANHPRRGETRAPILGQNVTMADQSVVLYVHDGSATEAIEAIIDPFVKALLDLRGRLLVEAAKVDARPVEEVFG